MFVESFGGVFGLFFLGVVTFFDDTAEAPTKFGYDSIQFGVNASRRDSPDFLRHDKKFLIFYDTTCCVSWSA